MSFVPFHCPACEGYWLQSSPDIDPSGTASCSCGGVGRAISEDRYESADVSLFSTVVESLQRARLSPLSSGRLVIDLDMSEGMSERARLGRMSQLMPSLCIIGLIGTAQVETARKALRMFAVILSVMASKRSAWDDTALRSGPEREPHSLAL